VILAAENVVDLQFFLMDAARRHVAAGADAMADDLLASAAALDYALLLSSQHGEEELDATSAVGSSLRDTLARAANAALDVVERELRACATEPEEARTLRRRAVEVLDTIRALREREVLTGDALAFRCITLAEDIARRPL
jgi:hypothetical protein